MTDISGHDSRALRAARLTGRLPLCRCRVAALN